MKFEKWWDEYKLHNDLSGFTQIPPGKIARDAWMACIATAPELPSPPEMTDAVRQGLKIITRVYIYSGGALGAAREWIKKMLAPNQYGMLPTIENSRNSIPMILHCPDCGKRHIDEGEWKDKPHHTHACQHCGFVWRPAVEDTIGVRFLPGFKNEADKPWNGEVK